MANTARAAVAGWSHTNVTSRTNTDAKLAATGEKLESHACKDFEALLARADIEAVSICLPDRQHKRAAVAAAGAGKSAADGRPHPALRPALGAGLRGGRA